MGAWFLDSELSTCLALWLFMIIVLHRFALVYVVISGL